MLDNFHLCVLDAYLFPTSGRTQHATMRQNTFTLVPNPVGMQRLVQRESGGVPARPAMTSKQAQKLHRQNSRQPKRSKAEQRRLELEEQERIRKELEKDKRISRAREARERKKAKEQKALEERKRKRLPTVDVTSSQDTIARFARGNGTSKKRDSAGSRVHRETAVLGIQAVVSTTHSDLVGGESGMKDEEHSEKLVDTADQRCLPSTEMRSNRGSGPGEYSEEKLDSPGERQDVPGGRHSKSAPPSTLNETACSQQRKKRSSSVPGPNLRSATGQSLHLIKADMEHEHSTAQLPPSSKIQATSPNDFVRKDANSRNSQKPQSAKLPLPPQTRPPDQTTQLEKLNPDPPRPRRVLEEISSDRLNSISISRPPAGALEKRKPSPQEAHKHPPDQISRSMPPPPFKRPRLRPPLLSSTSGRRELPKFLPAQKNTPSPRPAPTVNSQIHNNPRQLECSLDVPSLSTPPSSTQAFVFSHLDDLFPTPSQEKRELQGADPPYRDVPSPLPRRPPAFSAPGPSVIRETPKTVARPHQKPPTRCSVPHQRKDEDDLSLPFFSTQDFILSSQDMRDLEPSTINTPTIVTSTSASKLTGLPEFRRANTPANDLSPGALRRSFTRTAATAPTTAAPRPNPVGQWPTDRPLPPPDARTRNGVRNPTDPGARGGLGGSCDLPQKPLSSSHRLASLDPSISRGASLPAKIAPAPPESTDGSGVHTAGSSLGPSPQASSASHERIFRPQQSPPASTISSGSSPKRRFFTSSNSEAVYLAMERSRRTHREEERTREAGSYRKPAVVRHEPWEAPKDEGDVRRGKGNRGKGNAAEEEKKESEDRVQCTQQRDLEREELEELESLAQQLADEVDSEELHFEETEQERPAERMAREDMNGSLDGAHIINNVSQETDYGDLDWLDEGLNRERLSCESTSFMDPEDYFSFVDDCWETDF